VRKKTNVSTNFYFGRLDRKKGGGYDLIWEDEEICSGKVSFMILIQDFVTNSRAYICFAF
jgi:hypothetical protein